MSGIRWPSNGEARLAEEISALGWPVADDGVRCGEPGTSQQDESRATPCQHPVWVRGPLEADLWEATETVVSTCAMLIVVPASIAAAASGPSWKG